MRRITAKMDHDQGDVYKEMPELALGRGIIERAIKDALNPRQAALTNWHSKINKARKLRREMLEQSIAGWKASGLGGAEFCAIKGIDLKKFELDRKWLALLNLRASGYERKYPNARDWLWDDSLRSFSFLWWLGFFFDDVPGIAERIKKYVLLHSKNT